MTSPSPMTFDLKLFAAALLSGRKVQDIIAEFGPGPDEDLPIDLSKIASSDLASHRGSKVLPTAGVCRYLASDDDLTDETIDHMELSLERDFEISKPFYITTMRSGPPGKRTVDYFYLDEE